MMEILLTISRPLAKRIKCILTWASLPAFVFRIADLLLLLGDQNERQLYIVQLAADCHCLELQHNSNIDHNINDCHKNNENEEHEALSTITLKCMECVH